TSAKEVRIYRTGGFFLGKYRRAADDVFMASQTRRWKAGISMIGWGAFAAMCVGAVYTYIVYLASQRRITVGDVVMYTGTVFYGGTAIRGLIQAASSLITNSLEARAFFSYLDEKDGRAESGTARELVATQPRQGPTYEWNLRDVTFWYAGRKEPLLEDV